MKNLILCLLLLMPPALYAQQPTLRGPASDVTLIAEPAMIAHVDGRWLVVGDDAVRRTQATLTLTDAARKPEDVGLLISMSKITNGQIIPLYGQSEPVEVADGEPPQWRISVPQSGVWSVLVIDYVARRHYPLSVTIGDVPDPDDDDVDPPPDPGKAPFKADGFAVLIVREATGSQSPGHVAVYSSVTLNQYVSSKAVKLSDGRPFYRVWDDDYQDQSLANVPPELKAAYLKVRGDAKSFPWIAVVSKDGKGGESGPLPDGVDATLSLLRKWGG